MSSVSVIIPTYNGALYIEETIKSVFEQSYKEIEIIIVDDGSTDDTLDLARKIGGGIKIIEQRNSGQASARNRGFLEAGGEFISFLDQDDLWDKGKISMQVDVLKRYPDAMATYCDHRIIDDTGKIIGKSGALSHPRPSGNILLALLLGSCIITPGVSLIRSDAVRLLAGFNVSKHVRGHEDYDFWLRLAVKGPVIYHPDTLVSWRKHNSQGSSQEGYWLKSSISHILSFKSIEKDVNTMGSAVVIRLFQDQKFQMLIDASWASSNLRNHRKAIDYAWCALRLQVYSALAWRVLAKAILKSAFLGRSSG